MKILIFGSNGLVGTSLNNYLKKTLPNVEIIASTRQDTNLFSFEDTYEKISSTKPNIIINAAAKVGGIYANNTLRTEFILENLKININILESLIPFNSIKLINLGSSCIYPLNANNPIKEDSLLTGKLEPTNSPYAMAKLTAIEIGDALVKQHGHKIINLMPTNLYGPFDNFDEKSSHVIPGLISRMHHAKYHNFSEFKVWGTGKPQREFMYVDDLSDAISYIIKNDLFDIGLLNVGSNEEISISNLVKLIKHTIDFQGRITFDRNMPDGNPRKLLDSTELFQLGWRPKTNLSEGIKKTYEWFKNNL